MDEDPEDTGTGYDNGSSLRWIEHPYEVRA